MTDSHVAEIGVRSLTLRQLTVAKLIAHRVAQKEIAARLGISEAAVYKHVQSIKRRLGVNSLGEIAALLLMDERSSSEGLGFPRPRKSRLTDETDILAQPQPDEPGLLNVGNAKAMNFMPSIPVPEEPGVVPRLLDGKHRVPARLAVVLLMIVASLAAIILAVAAEQSVSEMVRGSPPDLALKKMSRAS